MIRYHPTPTILSSFAHGSLHHPHATVVSSHASLCNHCAGVILAKESALGALLEVLPPQPMPEDALERTLARAVSAIPESRATPQLPRFLEGFSIPSQLSELPVRGRRWLTPRIWIASLKTEADLGPERLYLVWAKRQTSLPQHSHQGTEFVLVLHGRYSDAHQEYGVGDFVYVEAEETHTPTIPADSDCLCLIGSDAPIRVDSLPARFVQWVGGNRF